MKILSCNFIHTSLTTVAHFMMKLIKYELGKCSIWWKIISKLRWCDRFYVDFRFSFIISDVHTFYSIIGNELCNSLLMQEFNMKRNFLPFKCVENKSPSRVVFIWNLSSCLWRKASIIRAGIDDADALNFSEFENSFVTQKEFNTNWLSLSGK